jgi:hypothetical protein
MNEIDNALAMLTQPPSLLVSFLHACVSFIGGFHLARKTNKHEVDDGFCWPLWSEAYATICMANLIKRVDIINFSSTKSLVELTCYLYPWVRNVPRAPYAGHDSCVAYRCFVNKSAKYFFMSVDAFFLDTGSTYPPSLEATTWAWCGTGFEPPPAGALLATGPPARPLA